MSIPTKDDLLDLVERVQETHHILPQREFDCLLCLIEDGELTTYEELAEYGFEEEE